MPLVPGGALMTLTLAGKMAFTAAYQLIYVVTAELFPTRYRSIAIGLSSFCAKIGGMFSPFINDILVLIILTFFQLN